MRQIDSASAHKNPLRLQRLVLVRPGGNDTALVFDAVAPADYSRVNAAIMRSCPSVEQVMFVQEKAGEFCGQMAGGEFCGNAARALGYTLLGGGNGALDLSISGAQATVRVEVVAGAARAEMPIVHEATCVHTVSDTRDVVRLQGISHLVLHPADTLAQELFALPDAEAKTAARAALDKQGLLGEPACGLMALREGANGLQMKPYVYVRAIDTFFAETACGSGSVAAGLALARRQGRGMKGFALKQPSGLAIEVDVEMGDGVFHRAFINGPVEILSDGPAVLSG